MTGDGNCQFRALSDQLFDTEEHHRILRLRSVEWLRDNTGTELEHGSRWTDFLVSEACAQGAVRGALTGAVFQEVTIASSKSASGWCWVNSN